MRRPRRGQGTAPAGPRPRGRDAPVKFILVALVIAAVVLFLLPRLRGGSRL
ncbi:hypothetical protein [Vallicoccus soli]|uniref:hypothetical protein n=1 Tax=Vallicoccus soli TaxID=2339232 RepID=UPI0014021034|nr:hypothetical protein [Vallicoccus soli]